MSAVRENILQTMRRIERVLAEQKRRLGDLTIVAVTKNHPITLIRTAFDCGITDYGENRVQEAQHKVPFLSDRQARFHFIGHLQSNKVNALLELDPCLIHSVDSLSLAQKLDGACRKRSRIQGILIQVNTSGEDTKSGIAPAAAIDLIQSVSQLPNLRIRGLMTIGTLGGDKRLVRSCFQRLRGIFSEVKEMNVDQVEMHYLSMGMTDDFEIALTEGSNCLRIGSAFFGARSLPERDSAPSGIKVDK